MSSHLSTTHQLWKKLVGPGDRIIDATVGNGHDTLYLARLLNGNGELIGYDIQSEALAQADRRFQQLSSEQRKIIFLKQQSHALFDEQNVKLIVYNLGYLPGGDKTVTTISATTVQSVQHALEIITEDGAISITCYPGHEEGEKEQKALLKFLQTLPSSQWSICHYQWINRPRSPTVVWIKYTAPLS